jgi:hypothetical protein
MEEIKRRVQAIKTEIEKGNPLNQSNPCSEIKKGTPLSAKLNITIKN